MGSPRDKNKTVISGKVMMKEPTWDFEDGMDPDWHQGEKAD